LLVSGHADKLCGRDETMNNFTYVDNSNVYIEGCRISAVRRKMPGAETIIDAMNNRVVDMSWQVDYGRLHELPAAIHQPSEEQISGVHRLREIRFGRWSSDSGSG
jgi:hypothetical protein